MIIQIVFFTLSLLLTLLFFLYGFNHYFLLNAARQYRPPEEPDAGIDRPNVSIHLPIYNERYVLRRLIDACAKMAESYGIEKVSILILDDSTDYTVTEIDQVVEEYKEKNFHINVIRRELRTGYKAGALQEALKSTPEEFIAIFDADFIPPADFLLRMLPHFLHNDRIGIVQSRWSHLNREFNFLTKAVAIGIDIHFIIEQAGRYAFGLFQNFNGSGGVIRKKAIIEAGGWQADTLAEDLDLSYRMQLIGYKVIYLKEIKCAGEIPPTFPSIKKQQGRWACGTLRTARKILPQLLPRHEFGFVKRLQAFIHMTGYFLHPLMAFSFVLTCAATFLRLNNTLSTQINSSLTTGFSGPGWAPTFFLIQKDIWILLGPLIALCTIAPWISSITTLRSQKIPFIQNISSLVMLLLLGFGLSISNTVEAGKALLSNKNYEFKRTPKYAQLHSQTGWKAGKYQIALDPVWILELIFACVGVSAVGYAIWDLNFSVLFILVPFTVAYIMTFILTLVQSRPQKVLVNAGD